MPGKCSSDLQSSFQIVQYVPNLKGNQNTDQSQPQRLVSTYSNRQNSKRQDLTKFQFPGEGGCVLPSLNPKCQDLPKFQFSGEGGLGLALGLGLGGGKSKPKVPRSAQISYYLCGD